jgi:hypothetical protein
VALKVLSPALADEEEFRARFARESELAASIDHPNIVPIYEAGEFEGRLYIAMRYVEGQDLGTILEQRGRLAPAEALPVLEQVGKALDAAHARGLVHRDVKPANILIVGDVSGSAPPHCYLCDFGLTKRVSALTDPTLTGHIMGTLDYISPSRSGARASTGGPTSTPWMRDLPDPHRAGSVRQRRGRRGHLRPPERAAASSERGGRGAARGPRRGGGHGARQGPRPQVPDLRGARVGDPTGPRGHGAASGREVPRIVRPPDRPRRRRSLVLVGAAILAAAGVAAFLLSRGGSGPTDPRPIVYSNDDFELFTIAV